MRQHSRTPASGAGFTKAISRSLVPSRHRSNGALPAAVPMDKWISRRRSLRPRNRLRTPANRIALARANAEVAGSMWVIGRTNPTRPFITHIITHKSASLWVVSGGHGERSTDDPNRGISASALMMRDAGGRSWTRADEGGKRQFGIRVHPAGIEPATYGFEVRRSIQLSYECMLDRRAPRGGTACREGG